MTEKEERLKQLEEQLATYTGEAPKGLVLSIEKLKQELGITSCDLDDDTCLNCGS